MLRDGRGVHRPPAAPGLSLPSLQAGPSSLGLLTVFMSLNEHNFSLPSETVNLGTINPGQSTDCVHEFL